MDTLANVRRWLYASMPRSSRELLALYQLVAELRTEWYRKSINDTLSKEFESAGINLPPDIDFFQIVNRAVMDRVSPRDEFYDDLFQEVAMHLLDRRRSHGLKKDWLQYAKKLQDQGELDNLAGLLSTSAKRMVRDEHRKLVRRQRQETHLKEPGEDDDRGGVDLGRYQHGGPGAEEQVSAEALYDAIRDNLRDDRSKKILDIIIDKDVRGFLRGKGVQILADELDTSPSMASYYRDNVFKPDLKRALRRIGDRDLIQRAKEIFASTPAVQVLWELDDLAEALTE